VYKVPDMKRRGPYMRVTVRTRPELLGKYRAPGNVESVSFSEDKICVQLGDEQVGLSL
jgi:hypothetical protein